MKNSETTEQTEMQLAPTLRPEVSKALQVAFGKCVNLIGRDDALRELGFASQIIAKSPSLQKCNISSIIDSVVNASRANVTLNPALRLSYLIPRKGEATLDISYMGLITILKKSGGCKYIDAYVVYQDEDFSYNPAMGQINHTPHFATTEAEQKARKIIGCYSRAILPTNDVVFCYMPYWEIEKVKRFSEGSESKWSAWTTWAEEMVKKSVIKRHFKMLVSGTEASEVVEALRIEDENNPLIKQPNKTSLFDLDFEEK
jgi:recombination protein RecT